MTQYLMTDSALTPTLWGTGPFDFTFLSRIRGTAPALPVFIDPSGPGVRGVRPELSRGVQSGVAGRHGVRGQRVRRGLRHRHRRGGGGRVADGASIAANLKRMSDTASGTSVPRSGPGSIRPA